MFFGLQGVERKELESELFADVLCYKYIIINKYIPIVDSAILF